MEASNRDQSQSWIGRSSSLQRKASQTANARVSIRKRREGREKQISKLVAKWATVLSDVVKAGGGLINTKLGKSYHPLGRNNDKHRVGCGKAGR